MNEIIFEILKMAIMLVIVLFARYVIPYIKLQVENTKYAWLVKWVELSVKSAEQTILGNKTGAEKKAVVTEFIKDLLIQKNILISDQQLDTLIESAVYIMNKEAA